MNWSDEIPYDRVSPRSSCPMIPEIFVRKSEKENSNSKPSFMEQAESTSALGNCKSEEVTAGAEPVDLDTELISVSELPNGIKEPNPLENSKVPRITSTFIREISVSENGSGPIEGDGSNGLIREEMVDVDTINGELGSTADADAITEELDSSTAQENGVNRELGSSTAKENGVYCNGKAPGWKESPSRTEEHAGDQVVPRCPSRHS